MTRMAAAATTTYEDTIDGEKFRAQGAIKGKRFEGVWTTFDAKGRTRIVVDLTGEPCAGREQIKHDLTNAIVARHLPTFDVPELDGVATVKWQKLDAPKELPLYLKALASKEPLLRRRALWELSQAIGSDQGSVGEATPAALPFLVKILEGRSADPIGRKHALTLLETIADNTSFAEEPDELFEATAKALKKILPGLRRLSRIAPMIERAQLREIISLIEGDDGDD